MSKLHELIAQLCPNGVPYRPLGEIATITRGGSLQKKDLRNAGVPAFHYGQIYTRYGVSARETFSYVTPEVAKRQRMAQPNNLVMAVTSENVEDVCKCVAWLGKEAAAVSGDAVIIHHEQSAKFLSYYFQSLSFFEQKQKFAYGTKVIRVSPESLRRIRIPVPPRAVQEEIARILDGFTALEAELEAELEARKKQYAYWRERLLSFTDAEGKIPRGLRQTDRQTDPVQWMTLGEICVVTRGRVISKDFIRDNPGIYPVFSSQTDTDGVLGFISSYDYTGTYLTWTTDGANAGSVFYRNGQFSITNVCGLIRLTTTHANLRYLYHYLKLYAPTYVSRGMGNPKLMSNVMKRIPIPLPPLAEQERIVGVLDRFEALCGDLGDGLPREIALRREQMAYWRERLLAFRELDEAEEARA